MIAARATLLDVAHLAGVSRTTASFVLTGRTDMRISADATRRVRDAARDLNYRPNRMARSLRTSVTQTIGLITDTVAAEGFAGELIRGALSTALRHDHLLFVGETQGDPAIEERLAEDLLDRGVDGFVQAAAYTREIEVAPVVRASRLVLLNCLDAGSGAPAVIPDERAAGEVVTRALLEAGHTDGIHLVGEAPPDVFAARERVAGVQHVLDEVGLRLASRAECFWWPDPAYHAVAEVLASGRPVTALICLNDRVALGAYQALGEAGTTIPDDVSVVSFDDSSLASWLRPQLASAAIPHFDLGRSAVELLLRQDRAPGVHRVPMPLRRRASLGPAPATPWRRPS
jgi:LacI family transcriptional regulator